MATYLSNMDIILSDEAESVQLEKSKWSNIIRNQDKVFRLVQGLHKIKVIEGELKHKFTNSGSRIGIMYRYVNANILSVTHLR